MAKGAAPLRSIGTHKFIIPITHHHGLIHEDIVCYISCTPDQITKMHETPTLVYMKGPYYTFANSAYDIRVSGTDPKQVAQAYLQQLLDAVRVYSPVKWQHATRVVWVNA